MVIRDSALLFAQPGMLPEKALSNLLGQARRARAGWQFSTSIGSTSWSLPQPNWLAEGARQRSSWGLGFMRIHQSTRPRSFMSNSRVLRLLSKLAHLRMGVFCSLFTAGWCGLGSALGRFAPNWQHRHVAGFWQAPRWHDVWDFVLLVAIAVWCLHAALRLREVSIGSKRPLGAIGNVQRVALIQTVIVVALGVYAWFVIATPTEEFDVTAQGTTIHGEQYRALRVEARTPDMRPWQSPAVWLERRVGTTSEKMRVDRGRWWPSRASSYDLAMARARLAPHGAIVRHGDEQFTLHTGKPTQHGFLTFILKTLHRNQHTSKVNKAVVEIDGQKHVLPLDPEWAGENAFLGMKESPVILLRVHRNLTRELAVLALSLLAMAAILRRVEKGTASRANS